MSDTSATNITRSRSLLWRFWKLQFPKVCQPNFSRLIQRKFRKKIYIETTYSRIVFSQKVCFQSDGPPLQPGKAAGQTHPPSPRWAPKNPWFSWGEILSYSNKVLGVLHKKNPSYPIYFTVAKILGITSMAQFDHHSPNPQPGHPAGLMGFPFIQTGNKAATPIP